MVSRAGALALVIIGLSLSTPWPVEAHGFERPFPLPVPLSLYLGGAAAAVAVSFAVTALLGRRPAEPSHRLRRLPGWLARASVALPFIGTLWWVATIVVGISGAVHDFLPAVLFWVLLWVGVPILSALVGNPWPSLSPFRALVAVLERALRPLGLRTLGGLVDYPVAFGRWPAVAFLFGALCFELVVPGSFAGDTIGWLLLVYSGLTLLGILVFGATAWLRNAELFEVLFGWFGRIGPVGRRSVSRVLCEECPEGCNPDRCVDCPDCTVTRATGEQEPVFRPWFAGLTEVRTANWSDAAFILLALAGVSYDGLRETVAWGAVVTVLFDPIERGIGPLNTIIALDAIGLAGLWLLFLLAFGLATLVTRVIARGAASRSELAGRYAATLLPIAAGYLIAHYFTLLLQGIIWLPALLSDPRSVAPDVGWVPSQVIWYASVAAIVIGHIAAVILAHRLATGEGRGRALLVGLPLVLLMLGYTVFSLWIIAQPLTVEPV